MLSYMLEKKSWDSANKNKCSWLSHIMYLKLEKSTSASEGKKVKGKKHKSLYNVLMSLEVRLLDPGVQNNNNNNNNIIKISGDSTSMHNI